MCRLCSLIVCAGVLSTGLAGLRLDAKPKPRNAVTESKLFREKLSKDQQILHALDRLSYGPRRGDLDRLKKLGVKKWVDHQLYPDTLAEDPVLEARLKSLSTLRMSPLRIWQKYPRPEMIGAYLAGKPQPTDSELARNVAEESTLFRLKPDAAPNPAAKDIEPIAKLGDFLEPSQINRLEKGPAAEKLSIVNSIPPARADAFLLAVPNNIRQSLLATAPVPLRRKILLLNSPQQVIAYDLLEAKLDRAIYSTHQLEEQLVDFWYNHFNIYLDKGNERYTVPLYELNSIRPHVFGHFRDLLQATAESPAMMYYLDNFQSVAPPPPGAPPKKNSRGLNENYARELLELHTLGVDGGYTQNDIIEVARCFTGWTIQDQPHGSVFYYNDKVHDRGAKTVLGVTIPAGGGQSDGVKVLDILAAHPSTALFVSRKLAQRFVADQPPAALVEAMAKTFRESDGDIRKVMKTMLTSREFWSAGAFHAKLKSPFEMIVSAARAVDADVDYGFGLAQQIATLGEPLYRKVEPTGYSNTSEEWINSGLLLARMNFALGFVQNRFPGTQVDTHQFGSEPDPQRIARQILYTEATPQTRTIIESALKQEREKNPKRPPSPALVAGLVIGSPDFQRR